MAKRRTTSKGTTKRPIARKSAPKRDPRQRLLAAAGERIRKRLGIETLQTRGRDALDFHEVSAATLKEVIDIAFLAGWDAGWDAAATLHS